MDTIRVLRLIEYEGPRDLVEQQVENSIQGTRYGMVGKALTSGAWPRAHVRITAVTLGAYPEVIEVDRCVPAPAQMDALLTENEFLQERIRVLVSRQEML